MFNRSHVIIFLYHTGSNLKCPSYYSCDGKPEFFALLQSSEILLTSWFENVIICVIKSWSDSLMNRKFQSFVQTFGSVNCPTELNTTGYARMVLRMTHSARVSWIRPFAGVIYFRESFGNAYPRSISEPCGLWWRGTHEIWIRLMDLKLQGLGANKKPRSVCFSFSKSVKSLELA